nr:putative ribonuclease H-like domain-containing protein [Tanacetum cinerariifolium]
MHKENTKNTGAGEKKTVKKPSQTFRGVPVGPKMGFKPQKEYRPVPKKPNAISSDNKNKGKLRLLDNDGNPLVLTRIVKTDSEVEVVFDETAKGYGKDGSNKGYGTNSLLEQWRDSYQDHDDYDPYDDDMYKNHDLSEHLQSICDDLDIMVQALATATYLINRLSTKILKMKTPLETLSEYTTILQPLTLQPKVFGCTVFVHIPKSYRDKLDPCAEKCVFVGFGVNKKGYRCYSPKTHRLFTSMNYDFLETQYYYSPQHSGKREEQGDPLSWLSYTSAATIGNEIQNHSTTSTKAPNISVTPEHPVPDMISEVSSSQTNNLDNPQPDNLDENNVDDIQNSTSKIL